MDTGPDPAPTDCPDRSPSTSVVPSGSVTRQGPDDVSSGNVYPAAFLPTPRSSPTHRRVCRTDESTGWVEPRTGRSNPRIKRVSGTVERTTSALVGSVTTIKRLRKDTTRTRQQGTLSGSSLGPRESLVDGGGGSRLARTHPDRSPVTEDPLPRVSVFDTVSHYVKTSSVSLTL